MAKFTDHLIVVNLFTLLSYCCYRLCIITEVLNLLYYFDKVANFGINTHKLELHIFAVLFKFHTK